MFVLSSHEEEDCSLGLIQVKKEYNHTCLIDLLDHLHKPFTSSRRLFDAFANMADPDQAALVRAA